MNRRDFLNGVVMATAALKLAWNGHSRAMAGPLPSRPFRDQTDDFQLCHEIWGGKRFAPTEPHGPLFDCVIVGGGISGLVAAWLVFSKVFPAVIASTTLDEHPVD